MCSFQLAVLATYAEADVLAVFHYCCSILSAVPFVPGPDNLSIYLERNEKALAAMSGPSSHNNKGPHNSKYRKPSKLKEFMPLFLELHRILFSMARQFQETSTAKGVSAHVTQETMDKYNAVLTVTLEGLDTLLSQSQLSEHLLLEIVVICMFSVHYSRSAFEASQQAQSGERRRLVPESLGLILLFHVISK